jgi:hypothetical protein
MSNSLMDVGRDASDGNSALARPMKRRFTDAESPALRTGSRTPPDTRIEQMMNDPAFDLGLCHFTERVQEGEGWIIRRCRDESTETLPALGLREGHPVRGFAFCARHTLDLVKTSDERNLSEKEARL